MNVSDKRSEGLNQANDNRECSAKVKITDFGK